MFKILLALLLMTIPAWSQQWRGGTGEQTILGTSQSALIGYNSYNKIVQPLDNLLATYCNQYMSYTSSSTITVSAGSVMVSSSASPPVRLMLMNSAPTVISSANLDTGSLTASTTYYVYATAATNAATSATYYISASNTAPSGQTYYYQLGSFYYNSSSLITNIVDNWIRGENNTWSSKTTNVTYQALTDGYVLGSCAMAVGASCQINTDASTSPSTVISSCSTSGPTNASGSCAVFSPVRRGDYYTCSGTGTSCSPEYFLSKT